MDIDLLVEATIENERRELVALSRLPDHAASELEPGDISKAASGNNLCPEGVDAPSQQGARSRAYWSI
jgi:hypothetical protein